MTINLGVKRTCVACAAKFYDLGVNPAKCPKCATVNDINMVARKRARPKVSAADSDDPLLKEKAKMELRQAKAKAKTPKKVEGVDLDAFEDIEPIAGDDDIEEIEEEDITLESLEEIEEGDDDDLEEDALEEDELGDEGLIDDIEDEDEEDEDEDEDEDERPAKKSSAKKPAPKKAPVKKAAPAKKPAKKR